MTSFSKYITSGILFSLLIGLGSAISWNCTAGGEKFPNIPPVTRLSNVPPPEDTITTDNPRLSLNWIGDDPDGYVVGFQYRWSYVDIQTGVTTFRPFSTILNIIISGYAIMALTTEPQAVPPVYNFFATLPPEGLDNTRLSALGRGDTILIEGVRVYASNSDSVRLQTTGQLVENPFPVHVNPNSGTFIFESQDVLNFHTFEVYAIDNLGGRSTTPATVSFQTPQVVPPNTQFTWVPQDTSLVLMDKTDTFKGIRIAFVGIDPNSRTIDYSWVVDRDLWPPDSIPWSKFTPSQEAYVTAGDFPDPFATEHRFYVRSRNEFGSIDTTGYFKRIIRNQQGDSIGVQIIRADTAFYTLYPKFKRPDIVYEQRILLVNNSYSDPSATPAHPDSAMMNQFYSAMFDSMGKVGKYEMRWVDYDLPRGTGEGFPRLSEIGNYSLIVIYADGVDGFRKCGKVVGGPRLPILTEYCYVGGKVIFSGWALRSPINMNFSDPFFRNILHIDASRTFNSNDFNGASGQIGYPDLDLDSTKMDSTWDGALPFTWNATPYGFGEIIYRAKTKTFSPLFTNTPMGVRYIGNTFNVVFFGFPLYYMEQPAAYQALRQAVDDIGELNR